MTNSSPTPGQPLTPALSPAGRGGMFTQMITAQPADIDELGHVNNSVWVRWIQDMATAHWNAAALPEHIAAYYWVVVRHEIDFLGNIAAGESGRRSPARREVRPACRVPARREGDRAREDDLGDIGQGDGADFKSVASIN
jgi:hypothetical protein